MNNFDIVHEKLEQAVNILNEKGVDLWLTFVRETSQVDDPCRALILDVDLTWKSILMVSRSGERIGIVGRFDKENIDNIGGYTSVIGYDQSIKEPFLAELKRLDPQTIAINYSMNDPASDGLTHGMHEVLKDMLADTPYAGRLVSAEKIVGALRGRKTKTEIERIRVSTESAEQIFRDIGRLLKPGMSEDEISGMFRRAAHDRGFGLAWDEGYCPVVTAGPDSPLGHTFSGKYKTKQGCLLHVDFGVQQNGFCSDLQRAWYFLKDDESELPQDIRAAWKIAQDAMNAGKDALRPGVEAWTVDKTAREALVNAGQPEFMHAFGHHVGRTAHDGATVLGPRWERYGKSTSGVIEEGNVFAIELEVQVPCRGYIGCEECVLVTANGAEYLSTPQTEVWCV